MRYAATLKVLTAQAALSAQAGLSALSGLAGLSGLVGRAARAGLPGLSGLSGLSGRAERAARAARAELAALAGLAGLAALVALAGLPLPAGAQVVVSSSTIQEHGASAGETYEGRIRLRNQGSEPQEVRVYQTDYLFHADGRTLYSTPGSHARSNAAWIRVNPSRLVIPGGQEMAVSYEVRVPPGAGDVSAGSYWSMVMIEPTESPSPEAADGSDPPGVGLRTVLRFGVQIATHVGEAPPHRLQVSDPRLRTDGNGVRNLEFVLANDGETAYRPEVSVEVYSAEGAPVATLEQQRGLVYPGTSVLQRFELADLDDGAYNALVIVDTGALEMFGAQFKLNVGSGG